MGMKESPFLSLYFRGHSCKTKRALETKRPSKEGTVKTGKTTKMGKTKSKRIYGIFKNIAKDNIYGF